MNHRKFQYVVLTLAVLVTTISIFSNKYLTTHAADIAGDFTDSNFESCVDAATPSPGIDDTETPAITTLDCSGMGIVSLAGIQHLTGLTDLNVAQNSINDAGFAPIVNATTIQTIAMQNNSVADISPLASLNDLMSLGMGGNNVNDLSPLVPTTPGVDHNLTLLHVWCNALDDGPNSVQVISSVNFPNMQNLAIGPGCTTNNVTSSYIGGVGGMTQLTTLDLSELDLNSIGFMNNTYPSLITMHLNLNELNNVAEITAAKFPALYQLELADNNLDDINSMTGMATISNLNISNNDITTIAVANTFSGILSLSAVGNEITDISMLTGIPTLQAISLDYNPIADLSVLTNANFPNIEFLSLKEMASLTNSILLQISTQLSGLTTLVVSKNEPNPLFAGLTDLTPISNLSNLVYLDINETGVSDISFLSGLTNLTQLYIGKNQISDITPLGGLTNLATLNAYENSIADISPIAPLSNLNLTDFTKNLISDISTVGSTNGNLSNFASGNSIHFTNNEGMGTQANYADSLSEISTLEGAGASIYHNTNYEDCSNGLDEDGDTLIDADDSYCFPTDFYVDYDSGSLDVDCGTIAKPCKWINGLMLNNQPGQPSSRNYFRQVLVDPPFENVNVYVKGTFDQAGTGENGDMINTIDVESLNTYLDITFQPWGTDHPFINGPLTINGNRNITIDGFEIGNNSSYAGVLTSGVDYLTIKNSYIHDMGLGIFGYGVRVADISNNIFSNNRGVVDLGPGSMNSCGGSLLFHSYDVEIVNNTLYNNCDNFDGLLQYGDIAVTGSAGFNLLSPFNSIVKQNIVYNDLTCQGANCYTYYYNMIDESTGAPITRNVNGSPVTGEMTNATAAAHGGGNNFIITSGTPFFNPANATTWGSAGVAFRINSGAVATYRIGSPAAETPTNDYSGFARPDGTLEAGALEYLDSSPVICGDGAVDPTEECDDGGTVSGDGCDNMCQDENLVVVNLYVDYDKATPSTSDCTDTDACQTLDELDATSTFVTATTAANTINIYTRGTGTSGDLISASGSTANTHIQPWLTKPVIDLSGQTLNGIALEVQIDNITIEGFEIWGDPSSAGIEIFGSNITVQNNYIHDNGVGILGIDLSGMGSQPLSNVNISNNILTNNNGSIDAGGSITNACGGVVIIGPADDGIGDESVIINNTLYNNCDTFNDIGYTTGPLGSDIKAGDITISEIASFGFSAPKNTIVKQNLVYNNLGGTSYYYNTDDTFGGWENINGSNPGGIITEQTAAAHGTGNNFIAATDPFTSAGTSDDWPDASSDFGLTASSYSTYQVASLDPNTPSGDFIEDIRPNAVGEGEAGALEYTPPLAVELYVDYDNGLNTNDCSSSSPCDSVRTIEGLASFTSAVTSAPAEDFYINVTGTFTGTDERLALSGATQGSTYNTITIRHWVDTPAKPMPKIDGSALPSLRNAFLINGDSIILEGFEIYGKDDCNGVIVVAGDNVIVRNNYIHDMGIGIVGFDAGMGAPNGMQIHNNILVNNNGSLLCGGISLSGTDSAQILNNTLYNNCDTFNANTNGLGLLGDIALSSSNIVIPSGSPVNSVVKQNLVYNDLGGGNTFFYEDGITVNGVGVGGTAITNATAAAHGTGNNFIAATDPFASASISTDWTDASTDFALTNTEFIKYHVASLDAATPSTDYLGDARPVNTGEAGAIESRGLAFYVDYSSPPSTNCALGTQANPCDSLERLRDTCTSFQTALNGTDNINIYVQGERTSPDRLYTPAATANTLIQPWNSNPVINVTGQTLNDNVLQLYGNNITADGFEVYGDTSSNGVQLIGDNVTIQNSYIHDNAIGVLSIDITFMGGPSLDNPTIQNNIIVNNRGVSDNGGPVSTCGGVVVSGPVDNALIINNTTYNNCDATNTASALQFGDIAATEVAWMGIASPVNPTVKQNIAFNDLAGANTYYFGPGMDVNGTAVGGTAITNSTAAAHGTGDNFSLTTGDPFVNAGVSTDWTNAPADFSLTSTSFSSYQIRSLDGSTPNVDFLGNARPNMIGEAGAVEFDDDSCGDLTTDIGEECDDGNSTNGDGCSATCTIEEPEGGSGQPNTCTTEAIKINLTSPLPVSIIDGNPVVNLSWANVQDANTEVKVNTLFNYLDTNPSIGTAGKKLMNVFTAHIREEILKNEELTVKYYDKLEDMNLSDLTSCDCKNIQAKTMYKIVEDIRRNSRLKSSLDELISMFVNDLLSLEQTLKETGKNSTPFTDFYRESSAVITTEGVIKIYRNGRLLYTESNTNNTSYTDRTIPKNSTDRVKYYNYYLINETDCGSETGESGRAAINPVVEEGTEIDVNLDLKIKVKESYDQLIMEGVHRLLESNGNGNGGTYNESMCEEAESNFFKRRTSTNTLNYILECYAGDNAELRDIIIEKQGDIITPLMLKLTLNRDTTNLNSVEFVVSKYLTDVIEGLTEEIDVREAIIAGTSNLGLSNSLLSKETINDLTEEEKELLLQIDESYFGRSSHAADITIEVYNGENMIKSIKGHTNLLGETEVGLGTLLAGTEYTLKVRLTGEKFVLPKIVVLEINNAEPKNDESYEANIALEFDKHFKYGNFDESDDVIDRDDLIAWGNLLKNNPELWSDVNIDGLTGIDLLDVITLQENWGNIESMDIDENNITLTELLGLFGLNINNGFSGSSSVEVPSWVEYAGIRCK